LAPVASAALLAFLAWTYVNAHHIHNTGLVPPFVPVLAIAAIAAVGWLLREKLQGWAFVATAIGIVGLVATIFLNLYPRVMVSSTAFADSLTVANSASGHYTLTVMTVATVLLLPVVLVYQFWTYRVFRVRVSGDAAASPADILTPRGRAHADEPDGPRGDA